MKKTQRIFLLGISSFFIVLTVLNLFFTENSLHAASFNVKYLKKLETLKKIMNIIETKYVEKNIEEEKLLDGAIKGMLQVLEDPFTRYMPPKAYDEMKTETDGKFGGLGIMITSEKSRLKIISPIEGTPAYDAGMQPGDIIVSVDGNEIKDVDVNEAVNVLRGPVDSEVKMKVYRKSTKKMYDFKMKRAVIKLQSVRSALLDDRIGYISISQFIETTADDLEEALKKYDSRKIEGLILDLRNNPGGLLTAAVEVAKKFIANARIVTIKDRDGEELPYVSYYQSHPKYHMVVLVNSGSASASEIVAGAIKDTRRGVLIGTKTFGKGVVQTVIPLSDNSALAVTTAKYYTPNGICIQGTGIMPDIEVTMEDLTKEKIDDIIQKRNEYLVQKNYEEKEKTSESSKNMYLFSEYDLQLKKGLEVVNALLVYSSFLNEGKEN